MIRVTARIGGLGSLKRVEARTFALPDGTTLEQFLATLTLQFGEEVSHPSVLVAVNGRAVLQPDRAETVLQEGDVVSVVRGFAGG